MEKMKGILAAFAVIGAGVVTYLVTREPREKSRRYRLRLMLESDLDEFGYRQGIVGHYKYKKQVVESPEFQKLLDKMAQDQLLIQYANSNNREGAKEIYKIYGVKAVSLYCEMIETGRI